MIPILIHPSVQVRIRRGALILKGQVRRSMVSIGFECAKGRSNCKSLLYLNPNNNAKFYLHSGVIIAKGTRIIIDNGIMEIGNNFFCNGDCSFYCNTSITIGNNNMYGWNVHFNTTSGHHVFVDDHEKPMSGGIFVGDHIWIGSYCNIAKGVRIADGSVVAQNTLVTKAFVEKNILIGGVPAKKIEGKVSWNP